MKRIVFVVLVLLGVIIFTGTDVAKADTLDDWGYLNIAVKLDGKQMSYSLDTLKDDLYYPGVTDGIDDYDTIGTLFHSGMSGAFVDIEGNKVVSEYSANSSRTAKHVKGIFNGTILPGQEPDITVELSWNYAEPTVGRFGDMSLVLLQEYPNGTNDPNGYRGDLRAEMDYSGPDFASINFGTLPAGTYTPDTPFLHLRLDFDKPLADFNQTQTVDYKDFAIFSKNWRKTGRRVTDISGTDGIPDGNVDMYDLSCFIEEWTMSPPL